MSKPIDIDTDRDGADGYLRAIQDLRKQLAKTKLKGVGILPEQAVEQPIPFFDVQLSCTEAHIKYTVMLKLRSDNLYLVGWRRPSDDFWYELGHETKGTKIINEPNTQVLDDIQENYNDLTRVAHMKSLEDVRLGALPLEEAIRLLSKTKISRGIDYKPIASSVLTLTFTIAEATRLQPIARSIHDSWWDEFRLGPQYANLARNWAGLSHAVQRAQTPGHTFDFKLGKIKDVDSAISVLGIMLHLPSPRTLRSVAEADNTQAMAPRIAVPRVEGQPLLEIFYVRIKKIDGEHPGNLYGKVTVIDGVGTESLWSQGQQNYIRINPGEDITLEGPRRPLYAADELSINLDLLGNGKRSPADPIAQGSIEFAPLDYPTQYDVAKTREISGKYGSAEVSYMAMSDGLYATITVMLIKGGKENSAHVYGDIITNNGYGGSRLFHKVRDQSIDVSPQHAIPMSRTIVAVPTQASLVVNAKLSDRGSASPQDSEIAAGSAKFQPLYKKSESQRIKGKSGEVEVQVTWM